LIVDFKAAATMAMAALSLSLSLHCFYCIVVKDKSPLVVLLFLPSHLPLAPSPPSRTPPFPARCGHHDWLIVICLWVGGACVMIFLSLLLLACPNTYRNFFVMSTQDTANKKTTNGNNHAILNHF
jgi:hypothetical protein